MSTKPLTTEENKLIGETIDMFKIVNESYNTLFANKTERDACLFLLKKYNIPSKHDSNKTALQAMIDFLPVYNKVTHLKYYIVRKPSKLVDRLSDVIELKTKMDRDEDYKNKQSERDNQYLKEAQDLKSRPVEELTLQQQRFKNIMDTIKGS